MWNFPLRTVKNRNFLFLKGALLVLTILEKKGRKELLMGSYLGMVCGKNWLFFHLKNLSVILKKWLYLLSLFPYFSPIFSGERPLLWPFLWPFHPSKSQKTSQRSSLLLPHSGLFFIQLFPLHIGLKIVFFPPFQLCFHVCLGFRASYGHCYSGTFLHGHKGKSLSY